MITAIELDHRSDMRLPWPLLPVLGPLARNVHLSGGMQPTAECLVIDDVSLVDFESLGKQRGTIIAVLAAMQFQHFFSDRGVIATV